MSNRRLSVRKIKEILRLKLDCGISEREIARRTLRERHNITTLVRRLEHAGFVSTERNKKNKRFLNVTLTDRGREVLSQALPVARGIVKQVMSSINDDDAALLGKSLAVLRQNAHYGLEHVAECSPQQPG